MNENTPKINQLLASRTQENLDLAIELVKANELQESCYYLYRFGEMLDYLRQFEHIDIIEYKFLAPQPKHIQEIEQKIGKTLGEGVKTFYEQCGSLFLFWEHWPVLCMTGNRGFSTEGQKKSVSHRHPTTI